MKVAAYAIALFFIVILSVHFIFWPVIQRKMFLDKMDVYMYFGHDMFVEAHEENKVARRYLDAVFEEEDRISHPRYIKGGVAIGITLGERVTENDVIVWRKDKVIHTASTLAQAILPKAPLCPFSIDASSFKIPDDEEEDDEEE